MGAVAARRGEAAAQAQQHSDTSAVPRYRAGKTRKSADAQIAQMKN
jgi:hypothetical protein